MSDEPEILHSSGAKIERTALAHINPDPKDQFFARRKSKDKAQSIRAQRIVIGEETQKFPKPLKLTEITRPPLTTMKRNAYERPMSIDTAFVSNGFQLPSNKRKGHNRNRTGLRLESLKTQQSAASEPGLQFGSGADHKVQRVYKNFVVPSLKAVAKEPKQRKVSINNVL